MGFYEIPDKKSSTIASVIKDIMIRFQHQFDDGASNMLGKKSEIAMQTKELLIAPTAIVTLSHSL